MEENRKRFVLGMLAYAAQRDVSVAQLCKLSNLDLKRLRDGTHPSNMPKQLNDLWLNASHLTHDPLFGLHFGESLQLSALGIVGEVIKSSATVGEALTQAASMIHLFTDLFQLEVNRKRQSFSIHLKTTSKITEVTFPFLQMRDLLMVFIIHELDGLLLEKIRPLRAHLSFEAKYRSEYERVLRCKVIQKHDECSLELPLAIWAEPILTANYELQHLLLQKVKKVKENIQPVALRERIRSYLMTNAYLGIASLEEVAANFNVSARTLQRKLQDENVSFQQLTDDVRKNLAEHYLSSGDYQIKEISSILGYNEISAFSRAFKRWTGKSPADYQA